MNGIVGFLSTPTAQRVGWALLHFLWQGMVVALLLAVLLQLLRRRSPQSRWAVSCLALAVMAALPAVTACMVSVDLPEAVPIVGTSTARHASEAALVGMERPPSPILPPVSSPPVEGPAPVPANSSSELPAGAADQWSARPWLQRAEDLLHPFLPWAVVAWLVGVTGMSLWHVGGWLQVRRLRHSGARPPGSAVQDAFCRLLQRLRVRRPVRLVESVRVAVPVVVGWLRPVILLPASALSGLSPTQLEAVLAHELAHIRRWDCLVRLLQAVVETLLFYHPAVWWVSRRIREESENCCDDIAAEVCGDRKGYADVLAEMASMGNGVRGVAAAATGGKLLPRIRRIVGLAEGSSHGKASWLAGSVLMVGLAITGMIVVGCLAAGRASTGNGKGEAVTTPPAAPRTAADVLAKMSEARRALRSATYEIERQVHFVEAVRVDARPPEKRALIAAAGTRTQHTERFAVSGTKYRYDTEGPVPSQGGLVGLAPGRYSMAYDGKMERTHSPTTNSGGLRRKPRSFLILSHMPLMEFHWGPIPNSKARRDTLKLVGKRNWKGRPCYLLAEESGPMRTEFYVDPQRDWAVVSTSFKVLPHDKKVFWREATQSWCGVPNRDWETEITYKKDGRGLWLPAGWVIRQFSLKGKERKLWRVHTARVKEAKGNVKVPDARFAIRFPDGTSVSDQMATVVWDNSLSAEQMEARFQRAVAKREQRTLKWRQRRESRLKVGQAAPLFEARTIDGKRVRLADLRGKYVLLAFWAGGGLSAGSETSFLKAAHERGRKDPRFAMVSVTGNQEKTVKHTMEWVTKRKVKWTVTFLDPGLYGLLHQKYGVSGVGWVFLIGPDGKVIARNLRGNGIKAAVAKALSTAAPRATTQPSAPATRPADAPQAKRIAVLVRQLGNAVLRKREAAQKELAEIGVAAVPALQKAAGGKDPERARRAKAALAVIRQGMDIAFKKAMDADLSYGIGEGRTQQAAIKAWERYLAGDDVPKRRQAFALWRMASMCAYNFDSIGRKESPDFARAEKLFRKARDLVEGAVTFETINAATQLAGLPGTPLERARRRAENYRWLRTRTAEMLQRSAEFVSADGHIISDVFYTARRHPRDIPVAIRQEVLEQLLKRGEENLVERISGLIESAGDGRAVDWLMESVKAIADASHLEAWRHARKGRRRRIYPATQPGGRKAYIPNADKRGVDVVLDLASGKMLPAGKEDQFGHFAKLGKGDLAYDRALICLRGAKARYLQAGKPVALAVLAQRGLITAYELPKLPCALLVTASEGASYQVNVLRIRDKGIDVKYRIASWPPRPPDGRRTSQPRSRRVVLAVRGGGSRQRTTRTGSLKRPRNIPAGTAPSPGGSRASRPAREERSDGISTRA